MGNEKNKGKIWKMRREFIFILYFDDDERV